MYSKADLLLFTASGALDPLSPPTDTIMNHEWNNYNILTDPRFFFPLQSCDLAANRGGGKSMIN